MRIAGARAKPERSPPMSSVLYTARERKHSRHHAGRTGGEIPISGSAHHFDAGQAGKRRRQLQERGACGAHSERRVRHLRHARLGVALQHSIYLESQLSVD